MTDSLDKGIPLMKPTFFDDDDPDNPKNKIHLLSTTSKLAVGKIDDRNLMSNTLQIDKCERIIFRDRTLDFQFEIGHNQYKDIDTIIINGIKFKRV